MQITCINAQGQKLNIGWTRPFWLENATGLGSAFEVTGYTAHGLNGSIYDSTSAPERHIVLTIGILRKDGFSELRDRLYSFFLPDAPGTIIVKDGVIERQATYYPESVSVDGSGPKRTATVALKCPDPVFYALSDLYINMANFDRLIEFDFSFSEDFAVEEKSQTLIKDVYNDSAVQVGIKIQFAADGAVTAPEMENVTKGIKMTLDVTMEPGDEIIIDTSAKTIMLTRDEETINLINTLTWESEWLMLEPGDNVFRFGAKEGVNLLNVAIITRKGYWGA